MVVGGEMISVTGLMRASEYACMRTEELETRLEVFFGNFVRFRSESEFEGYPFQRYRWTVSLCDDFSSPKPFSVDKLVNQVWG